ncbi:MAG: hypothetical protein RM021_030710 [Nostoc sp. EkiNYC01]|nr:hypothetical protein [Nostoc sp. EkiNYC01]
MTAISYRNTKTTLPNWVPTLHNDQPRGIAYETDTHFVHFYGIDFGFWVISTGLTVTEKKNGTLIEWVKRVFGAEDIQQSNNRIGYTVEAVWRPGLYYEKELLDGLKISKTDQRSSEQALRLFIERLDELLLYIEPDTNGLKTYSHKTRELLILSCTEVENNWKQYMRIAGAIPINNRDFTTKDYVKLSALLYLPEFQVSLRPYTNIPSIRPFLGWNSSSPTQSLGWYSAYNKTKHDRNSHFAEATLDHCIQSIAANLVMYCVRFSPFPLVNASNTLSSLIKQLFVIDLFDCSSKSFYIPHIKLPNNIREDLWCGDTKNFVEPWEVSPLNL